MAHGSMSHLLIALITLTKITIDGTVDTRLTECVVSKREWMFSKSTTAWKDQASALKA